MPMVVPIIGAAFMAASTVAVALGATAMVAAGLAIAGLAISVVGYLINKPKVPKVESQGQQLDLKLDPKAPIPVCYGRTATGGTLIYRSTSGVKNKMLAMVVALSVGPVLAIESYAANDAKIYWTGDPTTTLATCSSVENTAYDSKLYKNKLKMRYRLGETPSTLTVSQASGYNTADAVGHISGLAHAIQVCEFDQDAFPQGQPKGLWVLSGAKLYDPRKDSTYPGGSGSHRRDNPATFEFSENPYLAALDWTLGRKQGPDNKRVYGIGASWEEVDVAAFVEGANLADANDWTVGGVVTTADNKYSVLATILQAGGGQPIARGAQISCTTNAPKTSVFTLTSADVCGAIEVQSTTAWRDRKNTVTPSYREETQLWEIVAGQEISVPKYIDDDSGELKSYGVEFSMVQQAAQAHQLAVYDLTNGREFLAFKVTCKPRLLNVRAGDAIMVQLPQVGADNQKCVVTAREFDPARFEVTLTLRSETDSKHAFALDQSQAAPPTPSLNGYDPSNPDAPGAGAWSVSGESLDNGAGVSIPAIVVSGGVDDPNAAGVIIEYRPTGSTTWQQWGVFARSTASVEITGVTSGTTYDVAVSYRMLTGPESPRTIYSAVTAGTLAIDVTSGVITGELATGEPLYMWIAYADNSTGTTNFTTGAPGSRSYVGIAANKSTATESTNPGDYSWSLIRGADGATGPQGPTGPVGPAPFVLTELMSATTTIAGNIVSRTGAVGWDSLAVSPIMAGAQGVTATINTTASQEAMFGLTDGTSSSSVSHTRLNYAFYNNGGTLQIYESGASIGSFGTVTAGINLAILYGRGTVTYYRDGTVLRTAITVRGRTFRAAQAVRNVGQPFRNFNATQGQDTGAIANLEVIEWGGPELHAIPPNLAALTGTESINNANQQWSQVSGAGRPADNATVGATWGTNVTGRPTELTDGRISAGLTSTGDVARAVPGSRINMSAGNLIVDPLIADAGAWTLTSNATIDSTSSELASFGLVRAFKHLPGNGNMQLSSKLVPAQAGASYNHTVKLVAKAGANGTFQHTIRFYDRGGNYLGQSPKNYPVGSPPTDIAIECSVSGIAPANTAFVGASNFMGAWTTGTIWTGAYAIRPMATPALVNIGDTANMVPDADFLDASSTWGISKITVTPNNVAGKGAGVNKLVIDSAVGSETAMTAPISCSPGETLRSSIYLETVSGTTGNLLIAPQYYNAAGGVLGYGTYVIYAAGESGSFSSISRAPANTASVRYFIYSYGNGNRVWHLSEPIMYRATILGRNAVREDGVSLVTDSAAITSLGTAAYLNGEGALARLNVVNLASHVVGVLSTANAAPGMLNSNVTMLANGSLSGGGGGQVTLPGMGYTGALNATANNITRSATAPSSPSNGDIWVDTSTTPNVTRVRVAGAWQAASNYVTNTNEIVDGAGLGTTAAWASISSRPSELTDGRVAAALASNGDIARPIPTSIRNSSNLLGYTGGGVFSGALNATANNITRSATEPASPANGDIWVDTSVNPNVTKVRVSGAWQVSANYVTNTNQIADGAGLGTTAAWGSVSSRPVELTDGRVAAALASNGDIARPIPTTVANSSNLLRFTGGGTFTGALNANYITNTNQLTDGANLGSTAAWASISSRPTELTDGRISAGLASNGDLARAIPTAVANSSNLLRFTGGGTFTGALNANYITNTNQLSDGAGLGTTAAWTGVTDRPTTLAALDSTAATKLSGIQAGAQVNPADLAALDSAAATKLSGVEVMADVTSAIDGTAEITINCDHTGAPLDGQLPKNAQFYLVKAGTDVSSSATWSRSVAKGTITSTIDAATGILTITAITTDSEIRVAALLNGVTRTHKISINRALAAPPSTGGSGGGSGGTAASDTTFSTISSTSMAAVTDEMTVTIGSTGEATLSATSAFYSQVSNYYTVYSVWQRWNGSAWIDLSSEVEGTAGYNPMSGGGGGENVRPIFETDPAYDGYLDNSLVVTGLTAGSTQKFRLRARGNVSWSIYFHSSIASVQG